MRKRYGTVTVKRIKLYAIKKYESTFYFIVDMYKFKHQFKSHLFKKKNHPHATISIPSFIYLSFFNVPLHCDYNHKSIHRVLIVSY